MKKELEELYKQWQDISEELEFDITEEELLPHLPKVKVYVLQGDSISLQPEISVFMDEGDLDKISIEALRCKKEYIDYEEKVSRYIARLEKFTEANGINPQELEDNFWNKQNNYIREVYEQRVRDLGFSMSEKKVEKIIKILMED